MSGAPPSYTATTSAPQYYTAQQGYAPQPAPQTYSEKPPSYSQQQDAPLLGKEERFVGAPKWNDVAFTVLFALGVLAFFVFLGVYWQKNYLVGNYDANDEIIFEPKQMRQLGMIAGFSIIAGFLVTFMWLGVLKTFAKQMIYIVLTINVVLAFGLAVLFFAMGNTWGGIIFLIIAGITALFFYFWRWRIPFAAQMLTTTVSVLNSYPGMIGFAVVSLLILVAWSFLWQLGASIAIVLQNYAAYVFCIFIFYWVCQVVKNVVHVTCAGTYASWYFLANTGSMPTQPSIRSFKRATTYSFGSICLGSLIVAILQTIRFLLQQARNNRQGGIGAFLAVCAECLIGCIEQLVRYFNMYAFTQVAIYGKSYCKAAKATWELFKSHGIDIIVNDDLIGPVLSMTSFLSGLMLAVFGAVWGYIAFGVHENLPYFIAAIVICFVIGLVECAVIMETVQSGVAAIIVCFAEAPDALRVTQPDLYQKFVDTYGMRIGFTSWGPGPT